MWKRIAAAIFFLTFVFLTFHITTQSKEIKIEAQKIEYTFPYYGVLPDSPLYFIKEGRDRILEFFTRDSLKKVQLYLLFSDKKIVMARELSKKQKWQLADETATKAEEYFQKIPDIIVASKKQGTTTSAELVQRLKISNKKHREIIEDLLESAPESERKNLKTILNLNKKSAKAISSL